MTIKLDLYSKVVLTIIAGCLVVLVARGSGIARTELELVPVAHASGLGKLNYSKDHGIGVACSSDGKYVYVAGTEGIVRSDDFGRLGSWEKTIKED